MNQFRGDSWGEGLPWFCTIFEEQGTAHPSGKRGWAYRLPSVRLENQRDSEGGHNGEHAVGLHTPPTSVLVLVWPPQLVDLIMISSNEWILVSSSAWRKRRRRHWRRRRRGRRWRRRRRRGEWGKRGRVG